MVVAVQTVYRPRTKEVRMVDMTQPDAQQQLARLYQQGWQTYIPTQEQTKAVIQATQPVVQRQVTITAPQPQQSPLTPYVKNNQIDLVEVAKSGDVAAIQEAKTVYGADRFDTAYQASLTPVTHDIYNKLTERTRKEVRIVTPVSLEDWNRLTEREKLKHYPEAKGVKAAVAAKLGTGVLGRTAYYDPSIWEGITPWAEEKGETATTARVLKWEADIAVPFVYVATNWHKLSNYEKGYNLVLDALIIGAIAHKPISRALTAATNSVIKKTVGDKGAKLLVNEVKSLNKAVNKNNAVQVRNIGQRIESIGTKLNNDTLVRNGKYITRNADDISKGNINTAPKIQRVSREFKGFLKDQRGRIGDEIKFPIPDDELAKSGLSYDELVEVLNKVGDDPHLFRLEIVTRQRIKSGIYKKIEKAQEEKKYLTYEDLGLKKAPAPKPKQKVKVAVIEVDESEAVKQAERILRSIRVKKNVKHAVAVQIEKQIRKQARIIAKAQKEAARKARLQVAIRNALRTATLTALAQALKGATQTKIHSVTRTKTKRMVLPATLVRTLTQTATATAVKTQILLKTVPFTVADVKREIVVAPHIDTTTDVVPAPLTPSPKIPPITPTPKTKPKTPPKKRRRIPDDSQLKVKKVVGIKEKAGTVSWDDGIMRIRIDPPYKTGDIRYTRLKTPQTGEGSQETTLKVTQGEAPDKIELGRGIDRITITDGKDMLHSRVHMQTGGTILSDGKQKRVRRGQII